MHQVMEIMSGLSAAGVHRGLLYSAGRAEVLSRRAWWRRNW
jgi:hypothetical protein